MKYVRALLCTITLVGTLAACSPSTTGSPIVLEEFAQVLLEEVTFDDQLSPLDTETVSLLYGIDQAVETCAYLGTGATAEEIALFSYSSSQEAAAARPTLEQRVERQIEAFRDYDPQEVAKLEEAVVKQYGTYVVLCVSSDPNASKVIDDYMQTHGQREGG